MNEEITSYTKKLNDLRLLAVLDIIKYLAKNGTTTISQLGHRPKTVLSVKNGHLWFDNFYLAKDVACEILFTAADILNKM